VQVGHHGAAVRTRRREESEEEGRGGGGGGGGLRESRGRHARRTGAALGVADVAAGSGHGGTRRGGVGWDKAEPAAPPQPGAHQLGRAGVPRAVPGGRGGPHWVRGHRFRRRQRRIRVPALRGVPPEPRPYPQECTCGTPPASPSSPPRHPAPSAYGPGGGPASLQPLTDLPGGKAHRVSLGESIREQILAALGAQGFGGVPGEGGNGAQSQAGGGGAELRRVQTQRMISPPALTRTRTLKASGDEIRLLLRSRTSTQLLGAESPGGH